MRKFYLLIACLFLIFSTITFVYRKHKIEKLIILQGEVGSVEENEGYDGPEQRDELDFMKMKDPSLDFVPYNRLNEAIDYTNDLKSALASQNSNSRTQTTLLWQERGPNYDSVGPSNGNTRGGNLYTSGRMAAVLIDTLNDPSGNTVIVGGIAGGVWKCKNFLSSIPDWYNVNDYFENMAISSLCQDPAHPNIMYFSTGEATSNADAHFGGGIWKSVDGGETWSRLPSTITFIRNYKILCDAAGNIYLAARITVTPVAQSNGLMRSTDGGATWVNITPTLVGNVSSTGTCTDIEISSTGKLYASFGYLGSVVRPYVTNSPATVTPTTGWTLGTGIRTTGVSAVRLELACQADTVYGVTVNTSYNADSCYKSIDGGVTWTKQNTTVMPGGVLSGQGWYNETLAINPSNSSEIICGGLDAYRSTNGGTTWTRITFWVTSVPYVHADHHFMQWWKKGTESRIAIGCDGGIFYSNDGGNIWVDKNRNLSLKQFYAAAIHPAAGSPYLLAGAQDNGCHQLQNPGLSYSFEVTGGDGMYVYINQQDPSVQFGSYVYNQYRRTTNGGQSWSSVNFSGSAGLFANPYDYDDAQNIMYACYSANNLFRWPNANTSTTANIVAISALNGGQASGIKVSPYTANRVYLGSTNGRVLRVDNANATPTVTNITGASFPTGYINCVNVGSSDNFLVATFTNYGINNVWYSTDAGTTWTTIDGNLPDMPVWWALFDPQSDNRIILGTETGVYTTDLVNGSSTVWLPNAGFPTTRVSMLRMRSSDRTVVASTYGRGLWTAVIPPPVPQVSFVLPVTSVVEKSTGVSGCRNYTDYTVNAGIVNPPTGDATVTYSIQTGGTAVQGVDFDFTTNGNFSSPSNQHVFTSGQTSIQPITVRVYDDAEVESSEFFKITFSISGSTNAVAGLIQTHTFTINDNDRYPIPFTSSNYTIGTYNTDLSSLNTPFDGTKLKHRLQLLYKASELQSAGVSNIPASISAMKIRIKTKNTTQPFKGFTISMANTVNTNLNTGFINWLPMTQVYSADYSTVAGDNNFNFTTPFRWDGKSNIVVQLCYDNISGTPEGVTDVVEGVGAPFGTAVRASTYSNYTSGTTSGCSLPAAFVDDNRMNATFTTTFGDPVATTLNSTKTEYLTSNSDLFYYTASGEIMTRVLNLSNNNYGCTQVVIDRAGTGVSQFWNTNPANYLMNKTFRILPTTNNSTGKYEVTFYFTKAEKQGWELATGKPWDSIQIIKLPSRISNVTPQNAQPDGPGTVQVIDAVKRTFGTDYYTLSGIFETGFSGYGFGMAGRMNTILTLSGQINANNKDIDLTWTTSAEVNSSVFEVQKSYDGINFHKIGTVQAAGNKLTQSSYGFTDHENVQENYYRIKMYHTDGYILFSNIVHITKNDAPQRLFIYPNPFTISITVRLARTPLSSITFSFYDIAGKLVKRYTGNPGSPSYTIGTNELISRATYVLKVNADDKEIVAHIVKQ